MLTYFVFIFFFSIVLYGVIQKKWMAGIFIASVYAFSSFCSILLQNSVNNYQRPSVLPTILYCSLLFIAIKPFLRGKPQICGFSSYLENKRFVFVGYVLSLAVLFGMILILPRVIATLEYGLVDARTAMYQGDQYIEVDNSIISKIGSLFVGYFGSIWYLYIIMFFYSLAFIKGKYILKILLIVASLSQVEISLTIAGRTNAVYWMLSFFFTLLLFKPYLSKKTKKYSIYSFVLFMSLVFSYFAFVTVQRSLFTQGGTQGFVLSYSGMSYLKFCEFIDNMSWHPYSLERIFPFTSYIAGTGFNLSNYRNLIESQTGLNIGIFYTFLGDIFVDVGIVGLLVFVLFYFKVTSNLLRPKIFNFKNLCFLGVTYVIPLHGVFYYSFWKTGDFCILLAFIIGNYVTLKSKSLKKINKRMSTYGTI